jgi:hypothetical protein
MADNDHLIAFEITEHICDQRQGLGGVGSEFAAVEVEQDAVGQREPETTLHLGSAELGEGLGDLFHLGAGQNIVHQTAAI